MHKEPRDINERAKVVDPQYVHYYPEGHSKGRKESLYQFFTDAQTRELSQKYAIEQYQPQFTGANSGCASNLLERFLFIGGLMGQVVGVTLKQYVSEWPGDSYDFRQVRELKKRNRFDFDDQLLHLGDTLVDHSDAIAKQLGTEPFLRAVEYHRRKFYVPTETMLEFLVAKK